MKKQMKKIVFERVEGMTHQLGKHEFTSWQEVEEHINRIARTAPTEGYDKCDFTVVFDNEDEYVGRFDLQRQHVSENNLEAHILSNLRFLSGEKKPHWMEQAAYDNMLNEETMKDTKNIMENYAIGQN